MDVGACDPMLRLTWFLELCLKPNCVAVSFPFAYHFRPKSGLEPSLKLGLNEKTKSPSVCWMVENATAASALLPERLLLPCSRLVLAVRCCTALYTVSSCSFSASACR